MDAADRKRLEKAKRNAHLVAFVFAAIVAVYSWFDPSGNPERPWWALPAGIGMLYFILLIFTWSAFVGRFKARTQG